MQSLSSLKDDFLQYIEIEKGRSALTVRNYEHYLTRFLDFIKVESPTDITESMMREYRVYLNRHPARAIKKGQAQETLDKKTKNYDTKTKSYNPVWPRLPTPQFNHLSAC